MSSTSGGYSRQLRLFLGRSIRMKAKCVDNSKNSSNDSNCSPIDSKSKGRAVVVVGGRRKSSSVSGHRLTTVSHNRSQRNTYQTNGNNCDNNCSQNRLKVESIKGNERDCISAELLGLQQHSTRGLSPRPHRKSYSLNDLTLLLDIIDNICTNTNDGTDSEAKCSKFKRTLSYFSGKSLIRRKTKYKSRKMGQNSSSTNLEGSATPGAVASTTGLTVKVEKRNDSCNQGNNLINSNLKLNKRKYLY